MSDEFLQSCINSIGDERPGLIKSRKEQREHDIMKNKFVSNKTKDSIKSDEITALEEGLTKAINSDNKGFLMIQKMGFKPGMGLGKKNSGITDPLSLSLKNDRRGLGAESRKQMQMRKKQMELEKREKMTNVDDYVTVTSKKHRERQAAGDLRKSKRVCHQLDVQAGIEKPNEDWFWPEEYVKKDEDDLQAEENVDVYENLNILTEYLRKTYYYCIWCGVQYTDEKDLQDCPGPERDLH